MKHQTSFFTVMMALSAPMLLSANVAAAETLLDFQASAVEIEGLQRVAPETIYAILPIESGDRVTTDVINQATKKIYATGYFSNVVVKKDDDKLTFQVTERPIISNVSIEGNSVIPTEALKQGFEQVGIRRGEPLKAYLLENVKKDIEQQYLTQGRYNAKVEFVKNVANDNTVALAAKFYEGTPAKIVDIKILGNSFFPDKKIKKELLLNSTDWLSFFNKKDRFSKPKFAASLEAVKSLYLNAGFVNFEISDSIVNISEDKKKVFIELSLNEGKQYTFGKTSFLGDSRFNESKLHKELTIKSGDTFSQKAIIESTNNIESIYGNTGYFYAKVRPVPRIDETNQVVDIDYYIDPGRPVYVRKINFTGNTKTEDNILRHEMRQLEGSLASKEKIELSKVRLQRTGFFKTVDMKVTRIPGTDDKVDINVIVEEQPSGSTDLRAGYSQNGGFTYQVGLNQRNFFGTGNDVNILLSRSDTVDNYNISVTDPYYTVDGISRSFSGYYRETKIDDANINNYLTDSIGAKLSFGYPVDEDTRVSAGLGVDSTQVKAGSSIAIANMDYMLDTGVKAKVDGKNITIKKSNSEQLVNTNKYKTDYLTYNLNLGWKNSTLDKPVFPNKGMSNRINLEVAIPGSDVSYQKVTYSGNFYQPLGAGFVVRAYSKLGLGNDLPFYKNFSAGGFGSLRGYETGKVGPRSDALVFVSDALKGGKATTDPNPEYVGGNTLIQGGAELVLPIIFDGDISEKIRTTLFVETAKVYDTSGKDKKNFLDTNVAMIKQDQDFRSSAGITATWLTPIGPISLSYAEPIKPKEGDDTQKIQFEIGRVF